MVKLEIEDKIYEVPEDLTLGDWKILTSYDPQLKMNWDMILHLGLNVPLEEVSVLSDGVKEVGVLFITSMLYPQIYEVKKTIYGGSLINLNDMTLGKFIDLEIPVNRGWRKNVDRILEGLYEVPPSDDWKVMDFYGGLMGFFKWRENLYRRYKKLFGLDKEEEEYVDRDFVNSDPAHKWYDLLMVLCNEDYTKLEYVVNQKLGGALNFIAWKKDQVDKENKKIKDELQRFNIKNRRVNR